MTPFKISNDDRLRQIVRHWKTRVQADPNVKVPAWFAALLDAAALAISDSDGAYADAMIARDREQARIGNAANDLSAVGTRLREGS